MKKVFALFVAGTLTFYLASIALAVGPAKKFVYENKAAGRVVLDGKSHADAGLKCAACHPGLYKTKPPFQKITMADLNAGKSCATANCHDGKKSFGVRECSKCHGK